MSLNATFLRKKYSSHVAIKIKNQKYKVIVVNE